MKYETRIYCLYYLYYLFDQLFVIVYLGDLCMLSNGRTCKISILNSEKCFIGGLESTDKGYYTMK